MASLEEVAKNAEEQGDLETAFEAWHRLTLESNDPVHFCRLGYVAKRLGMWDEAEGAFLSALNIEPCFPEAMQGMGSVYLHRPGANRVANFKLAKDYFARAFESQRSAYGATLLGIAHTVLNEDEAARAAYNNAIEIDPDYEEAYYNLAKLEEETNPPKAIDFLEKAIQIDPEYSLAHQDLGKLYQNTGDLVRAEYHFRRAVETDPTDYWAQLFLANLLAAQGKNVEAEQTYRFVTSLHPEMTGGTEFFARFLESIGKKQEAAELRSKPKSP